MKTKIFVAVIAVGAFAVGGYIYFSNLPSIGSILPKEKAPDAAPDADTDAEDFFTGTWQGKLSGECLEDDTCQYMETEFEMDIVNLKVKPEKYLPFSGWATVHYKNPKWISKCKEMPFHCSYQMETPTISGQIDGNIVDIEGKKSLDFNSRSLYPEVTHVCQTEGMPPETGRDTFDILGAMWDIFSSPMVYLPVVTTADDSMKVNFESEFITSPEVGWKAKINGVLYKVHTDEDRIEDTTDIELPIETDEHTRIKIEIPGLGEFVLNTNSKCVLRCHSKCTLDLIKGELLAKVKKLKESITLEIHMPQSICGVRGTEVVSEVEEDGTSKVTVLEGSVEFSDLNKEKTVVVEKNQTSVVKLGGLPSDPITLDKSRIPIWWE